MSVGTSELSLAPSLFSPVSLGKMALANRIVMAPLTRVRAGSSGIPGDLMVEYYRQRASVGMIITEGTFPDHASQGWVGGPGIATDEQAAGWRKVFEAVHAEGGRIVMQIQHAGRATHPDINGGRRILAPSAIAIDAKTFTAKGEQPFAVPEAMTTAEIREVLEGFVAAARRAVEAGADGVELHGANGYLLHQFLYPGANQRTDEYGGSPENRVRFVVEVVTAVAEAVGAERVGLRISPEMSSEIVRHDVFETDRDDVLATYGTLMDRLRPLGLAYLSVIHGEPGGELVQELRRRFDGKLIVNSGFLRQTTREEAMRRIEADHADAVVVGRALIANPDLVERWQGGHPENELRPELFYTQGAEGYTDYPFLRTA
ncbi:alkene reductase [Streptomyces sp. MRC013]|uniref:alkene reductase n=1 Tax=Streptomyces sp. MRC013 TaxID=2898276 RepID=UPI0020265580|nr:alkene reductase [Streptomyces sp. MRC013]URM89296.1 alkene reductase [Streptomyces sp. MRC013]